jgi:hypothetical protein
MEGQRVCDLHGGKSPQAQRSARQRILGMVDPALARVLSTINGADDALALKASVIPLRAAGLDEPEPTDTVSAGDVRRLMDALIALVLRHVPSDALPLVRRDIREMADRYRGLVTVQALPADEAEPEEMVL